MEYNKIVKIIKYFIILYTNYRIIYYITIYSIPIYIIIYDYDKVYLENFQPNNNEIIFLLMWNLSIKSLCKNFNVFPIIQFNETKRFKSIYILLLKWSNFQIVLLRSAIYSFKWAIFHEFSLVYHLTPYHTPIEWFVIL